MLSADNNVFICIRCWPATGKTVGYIVRTVYRSAWNRWMAKNPINAFTDPATDPLPSAYVVGWFDPDILSQLVVSN